MGFKRTSEGRVFFQGADNDEGQESDEPVTLPPAEAMKGDQAQKQILLLLKSLNSKLKTSKDENAAMKKQLKEYEKSFKDLEERTSRHEENYIDLEQKVARKQTETFKKASRVESTVKDTVKEFETARKLIETLETKTTESDKTIGFLQSETQKRKELEKKLKESEQALEKLNIEIESRKKLEKELQKRQEDLEIQQKEQGDKLSDAHVALTKRVSESEARQESLDNKIEEATSDYIKLDRKIDKIMDDRVRVLRKIERVEDAVMQTRDALNAKAMVLLTNQGIAGVDVPQIPDRMMNMDPMALQRRMQDEAMMPWWRRPLRMNSAALVLILIFGLIGGWFLSGAQSKSDGSLAEDVSPRVALRVDTSSADDTIQRESIKMEAQEEVDMRSAFVNSNDSVPALQGPDERPAFTPSTTDNEVSVNSQETLLNPDYTVMQNEIPSLVGQEALDIHDEEALLAAMERDPDRLAERLNEIEPSSLMQGDRINPDVSSADRVENTAGVPVQKNKMSHQRADDLISQIKPDPDLPEIAKKIETQAFEGVPEAQHDMGAIYVAGHGQAKQDVDRAVAWFEVASVNGVANAKYNLGVMYHQGMGVGKDLDKALLLYEEAAAIGHPEAQYNLGIANIEGIGVPYNPQKAAHYFESAARNNVVEAAYNLGLIYENGLLGSPRPDEALMWYKEAADKGNPEAKAALSQLAESIGVRLDDVNRIVENVRKEKGLPASTGLGSVQQKLVSQIQHELMRLGLYPGPVDGQNGPMTADAIRSYQGFADMIPDGKPTEDLLLTLRAEIEIEQGSRE